MAAPRLEVQLLPLVNGLPSYGPYRCHRFDFLGLSFRVITDDTVIEQYLPRGQHYGVYVTQIEEEKGV